MKKVVIIGGGDAGLTARAIAEISKKGLEYEIVNIEDINESSYVGGNVMEIKENGILEPLNMPFTPPPTRAERRKEKRKLKKRKR